ncbi:MAG: 30S ribosomal protein S13 [Planctomycetota bacterium]|nr:30S ribosomal protein S13 [Planctomycetota bacterium]
MPRIAGTDVPEKKKIQFALQYIHGIGEKFAGDILSEAQIDPNTRSVDLTEQEVASLNAIIDSGYLVEGALRRQVSQNVQRLKDIRCYRGDRHRRGLPAHGQRTRCNARTRKGRKKTVAGKKGVKG